MSLRNRSAASAPGRPWRIRAATALVIAAALATTAYGVTNVTRAQASPRVTVAAIDPSLVASTIAPGDSSTPETMHFGAGAREPA